MNSKINEDKIKISLKRTNDVIKYAIKSQNETVNKCIKFDRSIISIKVLYDKFFGNNSSRIKNWKLFVRFSINNNTTFKSKRI